MPSTQNIRNGMQVLGSDGGVIGTVDGIEAARIKLQRDGSGSHHFIPNDYVDRVDEHVHLNVTAAVARERWTSDNTARSAAAPAAAHHTDAKRNWLPLVLGGLVALALLILLLRSCDDDREDGATAIFDEGTAPAAENVNVNVSGGSAAGTMAYSAGALGQYFSGRDPVGRVYALEQVNFATGSAALDAAAQAQIADVAAALKGRQTARVSIRGFTDPAGDAAANQQLSQQRAQAVRDALVQAGAGAAQVEIAGLGETGNEATRANRRVEMTVLAR